MSIINKILIYIIFIFSLSVFQLHAADPQPPHIGYAYPAGGAKNSTFEVDVGGQYIFGAKGVFVSGKGVSGEIIDSKEPEKKKQKPKNAISESIKIRIKAAPDADPSMRELHIITDAGISNGLFFQIGESECKEILEKEPNNKITQATPIPSLPAFLNGQIIEGGDIDNYKFFAKKGQKIVIEGFARALIPYIADAVPGWLHLNLSVYDMKGNELAYSDSFRFRQDPVLCFDVPADGDYVLGVRDSISRGRDDFVYRVKIGELPYITDVFPLGASSVISPAKPELSGYNLPKEKFSVNLNPNEDGLRYISVVNNGLSSNKVPFAVSNIGEIVEKEDHFSLETAQQISLPIVINGHIRKAGESDFYRFDAIKGQTFSFEVQARRLGSPLDSYLVLLNSRDERLIENDDMKDQAEGMLTHHADSGFSFKITETGPYFVQIYDTQNKGGKEYSYRLFIGNPKPDFTVIATPASINAPKNGAGLLNLQVIRKDSFKGNITLGIKEAVQGISTGTQIIPADTDKFTMAVHADSQSKYGVYAPVFTASSNINGKTVIHEIIAAEEETQAFSYHHFVSNSAPAVLVNNEAAFSIAAEVPASGVFDIPRGKEIKIPLKIVRKRPGLYGVNIQLVKPISGISMKRGNIPQDKDEGMLVIAADKKLPEGFMSSIVFTGTAWVEKISDPNHNPLKDRPKNEQKKDAVKTDSNKNPVNDKTKPNPPQEQKKDLVKNETVPLKETEKIPPDQKKDTLKTDAPQNTVKTTPDQNLKKDTLPGNNAADKNVSLADTPKPPPKERVIAAAPAISFRIVADIQEKGKNNGNAGSKK